MKWRTLIACLIIATVSVKGQIPENDETDSPSSRRILGSSVVTSVSVVMETGNGKHTYYSDAVGHPLSKPHIASQVASPINLLNPDRYEFYTFNDDGELVKRLMTLEEIQGIIAGGDGEASNYNSEFHSQILNPENDVSGIVENVQNVLKEEIEAHKNPTSDRPVMDTPDVSANWNLILPAFFGNGIPNEAVTSNEDNYVSVSQKNSEDSSTTEQFFVASRTPPGSENNDLSYEYNLPIEITSISNPTESRIQELNKKLSTINLSTSTIPTMTFKIENISSYATSELPLQTNTMDDIFTFDTEKIRTVTQDEIISQTIANTPKIELDDFKINLPIITERVNVKDTTIEAQPFSTQIVIDDELPKITELVSMITRPTIKTTGKTSTMSTSSVTFPPSTQFTHYEQITQSSSLESVSNEEENYKTSEASNFTTVNDNFVILSLNDDKNVQNINNTLILENDSMTYKPENLTSNVEQIIANASNDINTSIEKITTENYNSSNLIEDILNVSTMSSDFKNNLVTLASSIIDPNRKTSTNIEIVTNPNSISTSENELPPIDMQKISTSEIVPEATRNNIVSSTTKLLSRPSISSTTQSITLLEDNLQKFSSFSLVQSTENSVPTTESTSTATTTTTTITTTNTPEVSTTLEMTKSNTMQQLSVTDFIPIADTSEQPFNPINIANRFAIPASANNDSTISNVEIYESAISNETPEYTRISQSTLTPLKTTSITKQTTENLKQKPIISSTFKSPTITNAITSASTKKNHNEMETTKPLKLETSSSTFSTSEEYTTSKTVSTDGTTNKIMPLKPINNIVPSTDATTKIIMSTTTSGTTTAQTHKITSSASTSIPSTSTSTLPPSTASVLNISEPYRKTEEMYNKIKPIINDSWKLVETVKPPETINKTTPLVLILTTTKPTFKPIEAYQSTKVDLSTQGNYGMPVLSEDMYIFSKMYNELALKFWNALSVNDINSERSAVVSPFGAISMLAMIFLGARGGTSGEMNDVLKLDDIVTFNPHLVFKDVSDAVIARKSPSAIVRELYSDSSKGKVLDFYKERVRYFYDGHVEEVDFKKIHNVIRRRTNSLISKQTRGQMPQYLEETTLSLRAPLSTLSTNIFQADCSYASMEGRDGEFYFIVLPSIRQRRLVPIPAAVWRTGFIAGYDPELDATAVSLGTLSQSVSTIFVMPGQQGHSAPGDVLLRLEARLLNTTYIPETWNQLLKSMLPRPGLEIQLPRFLHKSVINSTQALKRMGLKEMFNKNKANLQGLNGIQHDLYLSDMIQVNEFSICGENQQMHTEIYPSVIEHLANHNEQMRNFKYVDYLEENEYDKYLSIPLPLRPRQARLPEAPKLRFDRPFLYFVRHNPTGLILHMGRFNPRLLT